MSSEPIRQPANDLVAFDISRQSPEQIANLFARWKAQRKRLQAPGSRHRPPHLRPVPPIAHGAPPQAEEAAPAATADEAGPIRYSASFEALLEAREPPLAQRVWNPDAMLAKVGRPHPPRRRSKAKWLLAGAASVVAMAAVAGGALWERTVERPELAQAGKPDVSRAPAVAVATDPMDIPMTAPFVVAATDARAADWPMRQAVDVALMKAAPMAQAAHFALMPQLKPPAPVVQTASGATAKTAPQPDPASSEEPMAQVTLPLVPRVTTATVSVPVAPERGARSDADDPRPDALTQRGNDKSNFTFGSGQRVASSGSRHAAAGSGSSSNHGSAGGSTSGSDPASGGTGGDPGGGTTGGDPGAGDPSGGSGGDAGSGSSGAGSGDSGGDGAGNGNGGGGADSGGGDSGGGANSGGGGDASGGDAGGDGSGGGASSGGDSSGGSGDASSGDGSSGGDASEGGESAESGDGSPSSHSGIGGAIGGVLGGLGDAVGGALGGGKGNPDGDKDKDKDKEKDKDKGKNKDKAE